MSLSQGVSRRWLCIAILVPSLLNLLADTAFRHHREAGLILITSSIALTGLIVLVAARIDWQDPLPNKVWKDFRVQRVQYEEKHNGIQR